MGQKYFHGIEFCALAMQWRVQGVAMVSVATPSERASTPNQQRLVAQRVKITLECD